MERFAWRRGSLVLGCMALGMLAVARPGDAVAAQAAGLYASAKTCAACHKTIHLYWSESAHARAASRPSYLAALETAAATAADKDAARRGCAACHAPTALLTGDLALQDLVTREGVTCDFCHTVENVQMDAPDRFESKPGRVKRGPLQYAKTPAHESEYSVLHKSSPLLCAACHEHTNAHGVAVLSTYSEWQKSPYAARGMTCQECHMPVVPGSTVREGLTASQRVVNLHRMSGGSLAGKVQHGLELKIESVETRPEAAAVRVRVTNSGVGHALPGGLSTNALVLAVSVETGEKQQRNRLERVYRQRMVDAQGRALVRPVDLFLNAAAVAEDTRIAAKDTREERFTIPMPQGAVAVVARLEYRDESDAEAGPKTTLVREERWPLGVR